MSAYGIKVDRGQSYASIERAARWVRTALVPGIQVDTSLPGQRLFERLGQYTVDVGGRSIGLSYATADLPFGTEALTRYEPDEDVIKITLSSTAYEALESETPRARFSLCHEIGHAVMHGAELVRLSEIPHYQSMLARRAAPKHAAAVDSEWQANAFAAALLMPATGIALLEQQVGRSAWSSAVAIRFGASQEAASYRLDVYRQRRRDLLKT